MTTNDRSLLNKWAAQILGGDPADYSHYGSAILKQLIMQRLNNNGLPYEDGYFKA